MSIDDNLAFIHDKDIDTQIKVALLQSVFEQRRFERDAAGRKRWWQNSPLVLALVGIVSVLANGSVAYIQAGQSASNAVSLKQLEATIAQQTTTLKADFETNKGMLDFEYKIMEQLLKNSQAERACFLLSLVRAGMLRGLNQSELEAMAAPLSSPPSKC